MAVKPISRPHQAFRNWAFRRTVETGTVVLNQRRIYILPSQQGLMFALVLVVMLLGDINYNLSLGYVLTFLLAMMALLSLLYTFRNLARLQIRASHVTPVFAGESARFIFHFDNPGAWARYQIHLHDDAGHRTVFDLEPHSSTPASLDLPATHRGWLDSGRLTLHSVYPLGLFYAWSYLHFDVRALVYPRPAAGQPLPVAAAPDGTGKHSVSGDDDFSGLRSYAAGDALPRIAWKALAREQGLQVKQFTTPVGRELWLDHAAVAANGMEAKLEVMTHWVLEAEAQGIRYGLRLPDRELPPQQGPAHRAECLRRLALFGDTAA